jgi:hypothetical protein
MDGLIAYVLTKKYIDNIGQQMLNAGLKVQVEQNRNILNGSGQEKILYLIPKQNGTLTAGCDEYVYVNSSWEKVGSTDVDLSEYATKEWVTEEIDGAIEDYYDMNKVDNANKVFKVEHLGVLMPAIQNGLPNVDTTNNTLTFHKSTQLLLVGSDGNNQVKNLTPNGDVVIDYSSITSSAVKIYYNLVNNEFKVLASNDVPNQDDVLICAIRDVSQWGLTNHSMSISCPFTIDGKLLGVNLADYISNGSVTEAKLATAYKQSIQNSLNGKIPTSDKIAKIEPLAALVTALDGATHGRFPELDTTNKTLKIYKSTLLVMRNGQNIDLAPSGVVSISYSDISSSSIKIYYNLSSNSLSAKESSYSSGANDILICTIRDETGFALTEHGMSISCPYIIDGKLFGVNLADYIPDGSITESKLSIAYKQSVQDSVNGLAASFQNVVNGLSTNINAVKKLSLTNLIKGATFAFGSVANSTGTETAANNRICSGFINVSDVRFLECSVTAGYKYAITCYDSQKAFAAGTAGTLYWVPLNYQTDECVIPLHPAIKYIRITLSDTSNSTNITLEDFSKIKVFADYSQYRRYEHITNYQGKLQESIIPHDVWSNGVTDGSTFASDSTRIFSGLIELPESGTIKISTATGYKANYVVFDENMTRIKAVGYDTLNSVEIRNNYKWIVVAVKIDSGNNDNISPSTGSNCTISYVPTGNVQFVENVATSAATNAVTNAENIQHIDDIVTNPTVDISWEYGILWQNAEGDGDPPFTRIRSGYIPVGKGTRVRCAAGYQHIVFKFDLQKKWISNPNWTPNEIVVDQDCLIRITVAKSDNSVISESEINTIGNSETIIREFPQFIADNVLDFSDRIPSYYNTQLKAAINSVTDNIVAAEINGESFILFSDPHWEGNAKWSPALIKEIVKQTNINTIICGGDLIEGGNKAAMVKTMNDFISRFKCSGKFFVAFGNHDTNTIGSGSSENHLTKGETYALAQKQSDFDVQYGALCYYYFDNPTTKTRFIVLDTGIDQDAALDSTQRTWFQTTLNNMPTGYHALIFAHIIYVSDNWRVGMAASEFNRTSFMDEICTICDTFNSANDGKKVEAMFGGHTHFDLDPTLDTNSEPNHVNRFTSTGGIPIIIIDCDTVTTASADGQGNRNAVKGTITEQCFDIVTVDYATKKVKCVRIGRGSDRTISY